MSQVRVSIITPSGEILRVIECPDNMVDIQAGNGEIAVLQDSNDVAHWFDMTDTENPVRMDKTPVPYTLTTNTITLPGDALRIEITGPITDSVEVPAGETEFVFTADAPGTYTLSMSGVKYLPTEVQIAV